MSGRAEVVDKAGMKSAMAYNKAKSYKEPHARHGEDGCLHNVAVWVRVSLQPRQTGLGPLIYTNANHGAAVLRWRIPGVASVAPTAGTARAFSKTIYDAAVQATYISAGKVPKAVYMSPRTRPWPRLSPALRPIATR